MNPPYVLLLDDDPFDVELILANLSEGGFECRTEHVQTREEFCAALDKKCFDIILADYSMPSFDGVTAMNLAREQCPDVPFIFVSGALGEELAIETLKGGATDYVLKGRLERLVPSTRRALREAAERAERRRLEEALKRRAEELAEANRLKDEFLATVSHELRTPLTAILGWIHLLRSGNLDEASAQRALQTIERNARSQKQLIEDILDVSRIITGKVRLNARPVEMTQVIEAAIDVVRPTAEAKEIEIKAELDPQASLVSGDAERLQQIAWNLLANAVKFTPKGGLIDVRLNLSESRVILSVTDTGQGIAPEFLPHVFARFRQADSSTTRHHGGLGLGLAIVRHLVEMHGGSVSADSRGEGHGATFTVSLPLMAVRVTQSEETGDEASHAQTADQTTNDCPQTLEELEVLLVDDEPDARELLSAVLSQCGAKVTAVASVEEALGALNRQKFDALVSDIGMAGEDGYALIRKVRELPAERGGNLPAVALTAYAREEDRVTSLLAGYQMHLTKPVEPNELVAVVASFARLA